MCSSCYTVLVPATTDSRRPAAYPRKRAPSHEPCDPVGARKTRPAPQGDCPSSRRSRQRTTPPSTPAPAPAAASTLRSASRPSRRTPNGHADPRRLEEGVSPSGSRLDNLCHYRNLGGLCLHSRRRGGLRVRRLGQRGHGRQALPAGSSGHYLTPYIHHAEGLAQRVGVEVRTRHVGHREVDPFALDLGGSAGHVVEHVRRQRHVRGPRDGIRLAVVERLKLGELVEVRVDEVPDSSRKASAHGPSLSTARGPDSPVDVLDVDSYPTG